MARRTLVVNALIFISAAIFIIFIIYNTHSTPSCKHYSSLMGHIIKSIEHKSKTYDNEKDFERDVLNIWVTKHTTFEWEKLGVKTSIRFSNIKQTSQKSVQKAGSTQNESVCAAHINGVVPAGKFGALFFNNAPINYTLVWKKDNTVRYTSYQLH